MMGWRVTIDRRERLFFVGFTGFCFALRGFALEGSLLLVVTLVMKWDEIRVLLFLLPIVIEASVIFLYILL